jgi:hypothetical protein
MKNEVLEAYERQLRKLEAEPFRMGLPEEIAKIKAHIKTLLPDPKGEWDGDLGCYDKTEEIERIDT